MSALGELAFAAQFAKRVITGEQLSDDEFSILKASAVSHDAISPDQTLLDEDFYPPLEYAFLHALGNEKGIGIDKITKFFQDFKPERILIIRNGHYQRIRNILNQEEDIVEVDSSEKVPRAFYSTYWGVILIQEIPKHDMLDRTRKQIYNFYQVEEICHQFVFRANSETSSQVNQFIRRGLQTARDGIETFLRRPSINQDFETTYFGDPDEEIAKAMQVKIWSILLRKSEDEIKDMMKRLSIFGNKFVEAAERGELRIQRQGWEKILQGDLGPRYI